MPSLPRPKRARGPDLAPSPAVRSRPLIGGSVSIAPPAALATGVAYCETDFGDIDGKTANGLVRHSEPYRIVAVIDSHKAGLDSGLALGNKPSGSTLLPVGAEVRFGLGYGALVRAMTSPFVAQVIVPGTPAASERRIRAPQAV